MPAVTGNDGVDQLNEDPQLWQGPPQPPDDTTTVREDPSCQGKIGLALREALDELRADQERSTTETSTEAESSIHPPHLKLYPSVIDWITRSFGESLATTQRNVHPEHPDAQMNDTEPTESTNSTGLPPPALLRGKLRYYNRIGNKWRFVVTDAEVTDRPTLPKNRRKRERPSLWLVAEEQKAKRSPKFDLEILAYGDLE